MLKSYRVGGWVVVGGWWPIRFYCQPSPLDLGFWTWGLGTGLDNYFYGNDDEQYWDEELYSTPYDLHCWKKSSELNTYI